MVMRVVPRGTAKLAPGGAAMDSESAAVATAPAAAAPPPELEPVTGRVKWFDATRGFGFVVSDQIDGDVLLHFSVPAKLPRPGYSAR